MMPNRSYSATTGYRYGFNGKEQDPEVSGQGNQYDYGFRIYNPRLGRFLSVDPIERNYPWYSPFHFAGNNPIHNIDLDGLEECSYGQRLENQWIPQLASGKITQEQYERNLRASAIGGAAGVAGGLVALDLVYNQGRGTKFTLKFFGAAQLWGTQYHNPAKSKEQAKERGRELLDALQVEGTGIVFGEFVNAGRILFREAKVLFNFGAKALGEMGEEAMARQYGTVKPKGKGSSLSTSEGPRKPDGIPAGTTVRSTDKLYEAKVGFQEYSGDIVNQVSKDAELLAQGQVKEVTWVFYRSPNTGMVGASDELLQSLKNAGIKTEIAGDIPQDILGKYVAKYKPTTKQP